MNDEVNTPWSSIGYLVAKRTYCRRKNPEDENSQTEEWLDVCYRVINAVKNQLGVELTFEEEQRLLDYFLQLKGTVAGRFLWQLGTSTVDTLGLSSLQNCAFAAVDEPIKPFTWAFDMLMLGAGVGYNIQREYVYKLPAILSNFTPPIRVDNASADFIVPDSREGWVKLLHLTLESAFFQNEIKSGFTYSTQLVRGKGAPIKGFGGLASGPEDLCLGIQDISNVIMSRAGKQLRPIDCLDIMNILGRVVVSGNVRRSAQIAIGDCDDRQFLAAKRWSTGTIPNWRAYSNNSVVCNDISLLTEDFWSTYDGQSEPYGLINLKLSRSCGRLGETKYKDPDVKGYNPCAEQSLGSYETCCLAEIFLPNIESKEEFLDLAKLLYRICKHSLNLPSHHRRTEEIVHKNFRMGIGITGVMQALEKLEWCDFVYQNLRKFDAEYSKKMGWPRSIKLTTVKPSGTLSLLPGVTPGIHPAYSKYMIRRVRVASNHPLVNTCKISGYPVEFARGFDRQLDYGTVIVEFPFTYEGNVVEAKDLTAIDQLEWIKKLQTIWSDNSVSCTVYYKKEELEAIKQWLNENYNVSCKSISFFLHSDHGFDQAPIEEISKEEYERRKALVKPINRILSADFVSDDECVGGVCPVK